VELRYRVLPSLPGPDPGPNPGREIKADPGLDVAVRLGPGATIADLAEALATALGRVGEPASPTPADSGAGLTVLRPNSRNRPPHPSAPARLAAPRSGATVVVVPAPSTPPTTSPPAPVRLVPAVESAGSTQLTYGSNPVTVTTNGTIDLRTTREAVASIDIDSSITVRTTGHSGRVEVDGQPVLGAVPLRPGQLLRVDTWLGSVSLTEDLRPPPEGPHRHHDGRAREWPAPSDVADVDAPITLPPPPGRRRTPGFPWLSTAVPVMLGLGIWVATQSLVIAGFVMASVAFVVAAALEARREARREHRRDVAAHLERLDDAIAAVSERSAAWRRRSRFAHPGGPAVVSARHRPRWSRHGPDQGLLVRLGTTMSVAPIPIQLDDSGEPDLLEQARSSLDAARTGPADVVIDLGRLAVLALIGDPAVTEAIARSIVTEQAALAPPDVLDIVAVCGPVRRSAWDWIDWLPHCRSAARTGATAPAGTLRLVIVDGDDDEARRAGRNALDQPGACALWLSRDDRGVPRHTPAVVRCHRPDAGPAARPAAELVISGGPPIGFEPDVVTLRDAESAARRWSAYRPIHQHDQTAAPPPVIDSILDEPGATNDPAVIAARWRRSAGHAGQRSLAAPIGTSDGGVVVVDLAVDGPHALVAGTTGSGKSELLRTWLLSAALCHSPEMLNLLLVDYKGGTAFAELEHLPHSVGLVTDLDAHLGERVVVSLRAELRCRELLERQGAPAPPALVVAIDEFATLARELPSFVDGVIDVAQRGRSLGLHLILATQRPAGVVTDSIRANTSLRIAMRVADDDDSRDVVGVIDAAYIDPRRPGTALVRIGTASPQPVRVAHSGGAPRRQHRTVVVEPLHEPRGPSEPPARPIDDGPTQLAVAVEASRAAALLGELAPPRRPWRPPLCENVTLDGAHATTGWSPRPDVGQVCVGVIDRPDAQTTEPLVFDLDRHGGVLVSGPAGSGRSTTLAVTAASLARLGAISLHVVHSDDSLIGLLPTGSDLLHHDDTERTLRLLRRLTNGHRSDRTSVVLIDDADTWCHRHERTNRGAAHDVLARLCTNSRQLNVVVAVSVGRPGDLPRAVAAALGNRVVLGSDDGAVWPPGGGSLGSFRFQIAEPPPPVAWSAPASTPRLPERVPLAVLPDPHPWLLPVGIDADRLEPVTIDLTARHLLVLGPPGSGRSTLLRTVTNRVLAGRPSTEVLTLDGRDPAAGSAATAVASRLNERLDQQRRSDRGRQPDLLVVIDDIDELFDLTLDTAPAGAPTASEFDSLLIAAMRRSDLVRFVAAASVDGVARSFAESPRLLRAGRHGVLLSCDADVHPSLLHSVVPRREEVPHRPGRGWLVGGTDPVLVHFATPEGS